MAGRIEHLPDASKERSRGTLGNGKQYMSWVHETDFSAALEFLIACDLAGPANIASPNPLPQAEFAAILRRVIGATIGLPAPAWLLELGTAVMGTETELVLKSRRVVPKRLLDAGFEFKFPTWEAACTDLAKQNPI